MLDLRHGLRFRPGGVRPGSGQAVGLPRDVRPLLLRALLVRRLELRGARVDVHRELGDARLLGDDLGPHRDDLALTLDGRELRAFGSAGQQRTAAIALRLLEAETLHHRLGAAPLGLLDDPFAELDARRSARILELFAGEGAGQTILAVPREADIPPGLTRLARWRVQHGALSPWTRAGAA